MKTSGLRKRFRQAVLGLAYSGLPYGNIGQQRCIRPLSLRECAAVRGFQTNPYLRTHSYGVPDSGQIRMNPSRLGIRTSGKVFASISFRSPMIPLR